MIANLTSTIKGNHKIIQYYFFRMILDEFLSREEIKRYLYCLIFNP